MAKSKTLAWFAIKTVRLSGWILLPFLVAFVMTGYVGAGKLDLHEIMTDQEAVNLHVGLARPLIVLASAHMLAGVYLALRRWGWIKTRRTT